MSEFPGGEFAPGLVVLVTPDGSVSQVADDLAFPNGMAISPDGGTLIAAESSGPVQHRPRACPRRWVKVLVRHSATVRCSR